MNARGTSPAAGIAPGSLLGAFEVLSRIGQGGMGAVYCVRNRITGDMRALKVILPELAANPEFVDRFVREIRLAMAVEHPNLVRVFEPGMDGDRIFLPMELLEGESLGARLKRERVVTVDEAVGLLRAVGSALSALHARGILHRDVKPSNVFLAYEASRVVPKLLDLGAGKEVGATEEATATGLAIGSPHYMAPEQASGRKDLDARADQYALAVVGYQLLTGTRPYENDDTGHVLAKVLSGAPYRSLHELRPEIPAGVEAALRRAMSRSRDERFPDVDAFLRALGDPSFRAEFAGPPSISATRVSPAAAPVTAPAPAERSGTMQAATVSAPPDPPPATSRSRLPLVLGAGVGLAAAAALAFVVLGSSATPRAASGGGEPSAASATAAPAATPAPLPPPTASVLAVVPAPVVPAPPATASGASATPAPEPAAAAATTREPSAAPIKLAAAPPKPPSTAAEGQPRPAAAARPKPSPRPAQPSPGGDEPCHATPGAPCL